MALKSTFPTMKLVSIFVLLAAVLGCAHQDPVKRVTIYSFVYPPYTENGPDGLFIDLITEAYRTQGVEVTFDLDTLENAIQKTKLKKGIMLGSRRYTADFAQEIGYEEIYSVNTHLISIAGRKKNNKLGAFSVDEMNFAQRNNLIPIKYVTPNDGVKMLYEGTVDRIVCTDISCDQIKLTNPSIRFDLENGYAFPVDLVYLGSEPSPDVKHNIDTLKAGFKTLLENGRYVEIQKSYSVSNPIYEMPLEALLHMKIDQ